LSAVCGVGHVLAPCLPDGRLAGRERVGRGRSLTARRRLAAPLCPTVPGRRLPHGGPVPIHPLVRPVRPGSPSPWRLLAWVLGALLLTGVLHCPTTPHDADHGHSPSLVTAGGTSPEAESPDRDAPAHSHSGTLCTALGLIPQAAHGEANPSARMAVLLPLAGVATAAAELLLPAPRRSRRRAATPGRSTLTIVCRWRI
jgi:hypothetical protein